MLFLISNNVYTTESSVFDMETAGTFAPPIKLVAALKQP